jgi:hypothetical protein
VDRRAILRHAIMGAVAIVVLRPRRGVAGSYRPPRPRIRIVPIEILALDWRCNVRLKHRGETERLLMECVLTDGIHRMAAVAPPSGRRPR